MRNEEDAVSGCAEGAGVGSAEGRGVGAAVGRGVGDADGAPWTPSDEDLFHCDLHYETPVPEMKRKAWENEEAPTESADREVKRLINRSKVYTR